MHNIPRGQMPRIGSRYSPVPRTVRHEDGSFEQFNMHNIEDDVWQRALLAPKYEISARGYFWIGYFLIVLAVGVYFSFGG